MWEKGFRRDADYLSPRNSRFVPEKNILVGNVVSMADSGKCISTQMAGDGSPCAIPAATARVKAWATRGAST